MKKILFLFLILSTVLFVSCASINKDFSAIDPSAIIESAAAGATGDYGKALSAISKSVQKRKAESDVLAGYIFTRTYFFDGAPVDDPARITWVDRWSKTNSAGQQVVPPTTGPEIPVDDALVDEIAAALVEAGLAK
ncbi:MAG TPA: hypothetical protein P5055_15590 [Candidatus Paceibacterota bacterium]|nr:hypothetical protein [Candidatus Paceibacterota bacterium]